MTEPVVVYEDKNFITINKPAGLLVHRVRLSANRESQIVAEPTLTDWLMKRYPEIKTVGDDPKNRPGIVHRLDRATSGVMIIPRNQKYFEYLKGLFQKRQIQKTYVALVFGKLSEKAGVINKPIGLKSGTTKHSVIATKMVKEAVTEYKLIKILRDSDGELFSFVEVYPKTGRTHQIRVHFASIGHAVVGDKLYGKKNQPDWASRLMLHAQSLEFVPEASGSQLKIEALPPEDFEKIIASLGLSE